MSKIIITIIVIIIVACLGYLVYQLTSAPEELTEKEQVCVDSGGKISTSLCCKTTGDFPYHLCFIGPCGFDPCDCSPEDSHEVKICDCGPNKCFDRKGCLTENETTEECLTENETTDRNTYRNKEYGFEFKYPNNWVCFGEKEKHEKVVNDFGWVYYIKLRPKDKEYCYEGMEEYPVNIRILNKSLYKFDNDFKKMFSQEERIDLIINNISASKFITKMGKNTAWELTVIEKSNNLGYYFEFFNPIYVLSKGIEQDNLLEIFDEVLSSFEFLD